MLVELPEKTVHVVESTLVLHMEAGEEDEINKSPDAIDKLGSLGLALWSTWPIIVQDSKENDGHICMLLS